MKKRAILEQVAELRLAVDEAKAKLAEIGDGVNLDARLAEVEGRLSWLHERVDMLASKLERMRGDITLDDAAAKRLTFAVGQFSARLDRLEQPPPPKPRRKAPLRVHWPNGDPHAPRKK